MKDKKWFSRSDLKALGFTSHLISDLLPEPEIRAGTLYKGSPRRRYGGSRMSRRPYGHSRSSFVWLA